MTRPTYMTEKERAALQVALRLRHGTKMICACRTCAHIHYKGETVFCAVNQTYLSNNDGVCPRFRIRTND